MRMRRGDRLGSGGFGVVFLAEQLEEDSDVVVRGDLAVKYLADEHLGDAEAVERFRREVRLLDEELDHPNVMPVVGRNLSATPPFFVMPFAAGKLDQELSSGRGGDRDWVIAVFRQVLEGVAHAHARGVLHRDLKPQNVLFVDGTPVVSDFGLGKRLDPAATELTKSHVMMGTEPYMAPELFGEAKHVAEPADVYALGKVLWEMLAGRTPDVLHVDLDEIPREFRYFIGKCCRRGPDERYPTAGEALIAFEQLTAERSSSVASPPLEAAEDLVTAWTTADADDQLDVVSRLDDHLLRHADEEEMYSKVVPRLPHGLVDQYMRSAPDGFGSMLANYDRHISGGLPFEYCDVVAKFYKYVFAQTDDIELKRMILSRLMNVAWGHNRWYVGEVVADVLASIDDAGTALMAAEAIDQNPIAAAWCASYTNGKKLLAPVSDALARVQT